MPDLNDYFAESQAYQQNSTLLVDTTALTDAAATEIQQVLDRIATAELIVDSVVMESMRPTAARGAVALEGEIRWQIYIRSPYRNAAKAITVIQPIMGGKVQSPRLFQDSAGNLMPLEPDVLANYVNMGIRPR